MTIVFLEWLLEWLLLYFELQIHMERIEIQKKSPKNHRANHLIHVIIMIGSAFVFRIINIINCN